MKKGLFWGISVFMSLMILAGGGLSAYFLFDKAREDVIEINISEGETKEISFENLNIAPGESDEYTVELICEVEDSFELFFDFSEKESSPLKSFVYARIEIEGEVICDRLLSELLSGESVSCEAVLGGDAPLAVHITYYMPTSVGNEAQGAEANFEILITISNSGDLYE